MQAWQTRPYAQLGDGGRPPRPEVFDTATQRRVPVGPESGTARMYVCGITPYDATHIGHANTYVAFDLLHRVWLDEESYSNTLSVHMTSLRRKIDADHPVKLIHTVPGRGYVLRAPDTEVSP